MIGTSGDFRMCCTVLKSAAFDVNYAVSFTSCSVEVHGHGTEREVTGKKMKKCTLHSFYLMKRN